LAKDYSPQFSLKHMYKDLRLALETAGNLDLHTAKALKSFYSKGMDAGLGGDDFIGIIRILANSNKIKK
jgi:3-hydroxyisobutyrate dehydrogenase-like beta-hydroxyacid dehydrogenase